MALHCEACNSQNYHILVNPKKEYIEVGKASAELKDDSQSFRKYCKQCQTHHPHIVKKIPKPN